MGLASEANALEAACFICTGIAQMLAEDFVHLIVAKCGQILWQLDAERCVTIGGGFCWDNDNSQGSSEELPPNDALSPDEHVNWALGEMQKGEPAEPPEGLEQFWCDLRTCGREELRATWQDRCDQISARCEASREESRNRRLATSASRQAVLDNSGVGGANLAALSAELRRIGWPDNVAEALEKGFPIVGDLPVANPKTAATKYAKDAVNSVEDARAGRCWDRARIKREANLGNMTAQDLEIRREIWRQTKDEIATGRLGQPQDFQDNNKILTARFGRLQRSSKGGWKIRCIDDFKASGINGATRSLEKLKHDHLDSLAYLCRQIKRSGYEPVLLKADFKAAYRTVPIKDTLGARPHLAYLLVVLILIAINGPLMRISGPWIALVAILEPMSQPSVASSAVLGISWRFISSMGT